MKSSKTNMRIAIYCRSGRNNKEVNFIEKQKELAREYIALHYPPDIYDVEIVVYEDEGFSGRNFNRPSFKKFYKEERSCPFNVLIFYSIDRISRNMADFLTFVNELTKLGTTCVSIRDQFNAKTPKGKIMIKIASFLDELEKDAIIEETRKFRENKKIK